MRFQKNVSQEIRAILSNDLRRYVNEVPINARERSELRKWVQSGRSPYDNGWHIATDAGIPMDFVNALRFIESEASVKVAYDTALDDIVFIVGTDHPATTVTEELPF